MRRAATSSLLVALALVGCDSPAPSWDWERMLKQPKALPYAESPLFEDGSAMRTPPRGAIAQDVVVGEPLVTTGLEAGQPVRTIPIPVDSALLVKGRAAFDVFCAVCHGLRGDGRSVVGDRMELRRPPSLIGEAGRSLPPGRVFEVATVGYGLMRGYAVDLSVTERWAVTAYIEALQLSQGGTSLDKLPSDVRARAEKELR
jgi:mono/diheme cytochrome c family protein